MPRTFICYASADRLFLSREIIPLLNRHGIETWFSGEDIRTADEWEQSIRRGLEECDWFVVALSPRALESHWVRAEVHWAVDRRQGRIVPILLDACDPTALHLKLSQIQYVDFTTPSDNARRKLLASWGIAYQPLPRTAVEGAQRMREAIASDPPPPRQIVLSLPAELERICLKCLAKQPDQRYQTASDLAMT